MSLTPLTVWLGVVTYKQGDMDRVLLNGMHNTSGASHHSGDRQGCLRGTRGDVPAT